MKKKYLNNFNILSVLPKGQSLELNIDGYKSYLYRGVDEFTVAIPYDKEQEINDEFVGLSITSDIFNYDAKTSFKVLYLHAVDSIDIEKFAYIGADFIDSKNRLSIINDPYSWIDDWKDIFGDAKKNKKTYDVLGELLAYKEVFKNDKTARWVGPESGTHDIVCNKYVVEAKSSLLKTDTKITVSSSFQLDDSIDEYLIFVRMEPKPYGICINSIVKELSVLGANIVDIEKSLFKLGFRKGNRHRNKTYSILEMREYKVNENNFPVFGLDEINSLSSSNNIVGFKLEVDLNSIEYKKLK